MKRAAALAAVCLASCAARRTPPSVEAIRAELGDVRVERVEDVFFVATNGGDDDFKSCRAVVERMCRYLARAYFDKRPTEPVRVYCFKDDRSYSAYCRTTYRKEPSTPYGFYLHDERTAVIDFATGTGTLAHLLVYPLLEADFPAPPKWLTVGLASLFEESRATAGGGIAGVRNWRWRGLHEAMDGNRAITLGALIDLTETEFYEESRGVHFATARYLCMWLQEKGKLRECYRLLRSGAASRAALETVSGLSLEALEPAWREWVRTLK